MHPYEVSTTLRERHTDESIKLNYGTLYTVVDSLVRRDLIAARETSREGRRPERTVYGLTDAGRAEFVDWLSEMLAQPVKEFTQFEAALSLIAGLPVEDAVHLLRERAHKLELDLVAGEARRELAAKQEVPRLYVIEDEYRHALRQAELAYINGLVADIEHGTLDGLEQWRAFHKVEPKAKSRRAGQRS
jgi:DNA-binding PadR family transcriptional regulator